MASRNEPEGWSAGLLFVLLWIGLCLAGPVAWWLHYSEWILGQMVRSREGVLWFVTAAVLALAVLLVLRWRWSATKERIRA